MTIEDCLQIAIFVIGTLAVIGMVITGNVPGGGVNQEDMQIITQAVISGA